MQASSSAGHQRRGLRRGKAESGSKRRKVGSARERVQPGHCPCDDDVHGFLAVVSCMSRRERSRQRCRQPQLAVSRMDLSLSCLCRVFLCKTGELQRRARSVSDGPTWRGTHTCGGRHGYHVLSTSHPPCLPANLERLSQNSPGHKQAAKRSHSGNLDFLTITVLPSWDLFCIPRRGRGCSVNCPNPHDGPSFRSTHPYPHLSSSNAPTHSRGIFVLSFIRVLYPSDEDGLAVGSLPPSA